MINQFQLNTLTGKMSLTFTLSGKSSILSSRIFPPVTVEDTATMALIGFDTFNSIPNVNESNNNFQYMIGTEVQTLKIPIGAYEIEDIEKIIQKMMKEDLDMKERNVIHADEDSLFSLKSNKNTLKCVVKCSYALDFSQPNSIGKLLGFNHKKLIANREHGSDNIVNITNINSLRIECNLITGSYINGILSHTIYEFFPCVPPGFKILENPQNTIYLPLNKRIIDEICIQIVDQDGNPVSFMNEIITVRLHLKKKNIFEFLKNGNLFR